MVSRFKELISENFMQKFHTRLDNDRVTVSESLQKLCINEVYFQAEDITWQSSSEGIDCQLLKVGSTNWEAGKLRIEVSTEISPPYLQKLPYSERGKLTTGPLNITVVLQFYPDNPNKPESPLHDLRKMIQAT